MPGFSKRDQQRLARLVLAHRGKLERAQPLLDDASEWTLIFCLRLAALLHRARDNSPVIPIRVAFTESGFQIELNGKQLAAAPLTGDALGDEALQWAGVGGELKIRT
jgi:exopolyphosphatase/guanosine-5'-triphosphate,3'-diphosphate pyrophosphatase